MASGVRGQAPVPVVPVAPAQMAELFNLYIFFLILIYFSNSFRAAINLITLGQMEGGRRHLPYP
jgi:hypothetical protein